MLFRSGNYLSASLSVIPLNASIVGQVIRGYTSQSADLQQWQDSSGTVAARINSNGSFILSRSLYTSASLGVWASVNSDPVGGSTGIGLNVAAYNATSKGIVITGSASQTANLQEWQDSSGGNQASMTSYGKLFSNYLQSNYGILTGQATYTGGYNFISNPSFATNSTTFIVKGVASQTANLQELQNNAGTILASVSSSGNQLVGSATQAGKVYNTNSSGTESVTSPLTVRGTATGQNLIELWAYGKDAVISNAVGNGTSVVYTTTITHGYAVNDYVTIGGISHTGGSGSLNMYGGGTVTAVTTNTFTIANTSTATYVSGGYSRNAVYPGNILQAYRSDGMSLFTIGSSGGFAMADVMSVANVGYQQAGITVQPNLNTSAAIRMYGRNSQTAEILDVRNSISNSGGSNSIFAIIPDYSVSANSTGYSGWAYLRNSTAPTSNPTTGVYIYSENGSLKARGSGGVSAQFEAYAATDKPLIVKGAASQSANLQEWQDSSGNTLTAIQNTGEIVLGTKPSGSGVYYTLSRSEEHTSELQSH